MEQVFRDAGALEDHAHQYEERHGHKRLALHDRGALDAAWEGDQEGRRECAGGDAEQGEEKRDAAEREGHGIARQQAENGAGEHGHGEDDLKLHHGLPRFRPRWAWRRVAACR